MRTGWPASLTGRHLSHRSWAGGSVGKATVSCHHPTNASRSHARPTLSTGSRQTLVLDLNADFDPGWSADARSRHGVSQIGIVGKGVSFINR